MSQEITLRYWGALGRSAHIRFLLEDAGAPYKKVVHDGSPFDPSAVAVPAVNLNGVWISQTMAIMDALGDDLGYLPPSKVYAKSHQTMFNIYDICDQFVAKRLASTTKAQVTEFVNTRGKVFFAAIEAGYKLYPGTYFYGDKPTITDFVLIGTITQARFMFGDVIDVMIAETAPTAYAAATALFARPRVKAFVDGGYGGESVMPPAAWGMGNFAADGLE